MKSKGKSGRRSTSHEAGAVTTANFPPKRISGSETLCREIPAHFPPSPHSRFYIRSSVSFAPFLSLSHKHRRWFLATAMSRRQSNGRSPLVNPQRQITSFFSKNMSSPSPSPSLSKQSPKAATSPVPKNPKYSPKSSPGSSPTTPSPFQSKLKKPVLVIGTSPPTPAEKRNYGDDVVGRRIKVYWPLDKAWYEGSVKSFNKEANKHLIQYDDAQEELLDLEKEKIQWVEAGGKKKLKRLRRSSLDSEDAEEIKVDKEEGPEEFKRPRRRGAKVIVEEEVESDDADGGDGHDDSTDEDWGKNVEEVVEDGEEDVELEEEDDQDDEDGRVKRSKQKRSSSSKRKVSEGEKLGSAKKSKSNDGGESVAKRGFKLSLMEPASNAESK